MDHGREKAVQFGDRSSLVGIVTDPAPSSTSDGKPAFIMLNSGILHRIGSCRLSVRTARALSVEGFTCLRFDYSGVGDSDLRRDALSFQESSVLETQEAMDYLTRTKGVQRFVLMGLCSGADGAHLTALADDRVVGLMMLDAWAYRTLGHYWRHYAPRLLDWRIWQNSIRSRLAMLFGDHGKEELPVPGDGVEVELATYDRVFPPKAKVKADLRVFVDRGIRMYCVWTGGLEEYNHQGQYAASFRTIDFKGLLREEHLESSDHIVTGLQHQADLIRNIVGWAGDFDPRSADIARGADQQSQQIAMSG